MTALPLTSPNQIAKVFVVNLTDRDFDIAEKYGELVYLTQGYVPLNDLDILKDRIKKQLKNISENDYLILSGSNLLCVIVVEVWLALINKCQILHYEPKQSDYRIITLTNG